MRVPLFSLAVPSLALILFAAPARADDVPVPVVADDRKVEFTVDADDADATLERRMNTVEGWETTYGVPFFHSTEQWDTACAAPCIVRLDPNATYRVGGTGVATSRSFTLPKEGPHVLHIGERSAFFHSVGAGFTTAGVVVTLVGVVSTVYSPSITSTQAEADVRKAGLVILMSGVALLAIGIPLLLTGNSRVTTDRGVRVAQALGGTFAF